MFPNSSRAAGRGYLSQLIEMGPPPYYFSYRRKHIPCQILEVYSNQVRVGFRDEQGRPRESWEDTLNVVNVTRIVHDENGSVPHNR
jgi:hypothetical protein